MSKTNTGTTAEVEVKGQVEITDAVAEAANVAVEALRNGIKIRGAIVARGRVDFPVTAAQAKELEALGLVKILGIWK